MISSRLCAFAQLALLPFLLHPNLLIAQAHRATARRAAEDDIRESVIRHLMKGINSDVSFIEIDGNDPTDDFMKRLRDIPGIVRKASGSSFNKENMSVVDKETGRNGKIFQTGSIHWLARDAVTVEGGYYCGGLCAAGIHFSVKRKNGKWAVISSHMRWIS